MLDVDASNIALGNVLLYTRVDSQLQLVAFDLGMLKDTKVNYKTYVKEHLSIQDSFEWFSVSYFQHAQVLSRRKVFCCRLMHVDLLIMYFPRMQ